MSREQMYLVCNEGDKRMMCELILRELFIRPRTISLISGALLQYSLTAWFLDSVASKDDFINFRSHFAVQLERWSDLVEVQVPTFPHAVRSSAARVRV